MTDYNNLNDSELMKEYKSAKSLYIMNAVIMGVLVGISIYGAVKKGISIITFLPIVYMFISKKSAERFTALKKEVESRNLTK